MSRGRKRNTEIKKVENRSARYMCFSKHREGFFKKAKQFHRISDSHVAISLFSHPPKKLYLHGSASFEPVVDSFLKSSTFMSTTTTNPNTSSPISEELDSAASFDVGFIRQWLESVNVEECESMEIKKKVEEAKVCVCNKIVESMLVDGGRLYACWRWKLEGISESETILG